MADLYAEFVDLMKVSAVGDAVIDVVLCAVPIWVALMIGMLIGWSWRPRWTGLVYLGLRSRFRLLWTLPPGLGARRLWLAFTALSAFSVCRGLWSGFNRKGEGGSTSTEEGQTTFPWLLRASPMSACLKAWRALGKGGAAEVSDDTVSMRSAYSDSSTQSETCKGNLDIVTENDLRHLMHLLDGKIVESAWQHLMEHTSPNMLYQAWRCEPEVGPLIHRSRTVFEDASPELLRDFFWDDDFRLKWDNMLAYCKVLEEFPDNGCMIVQWIKKFPFFCSDREYIFGRRIWESGRTYYCVTKGVPYPSLPKKEKPRRVELYFSSWRIRPVESRKKDGHLSACEVLLVHYEDMGIPKDVAKLGVRHGMWGAVKKLHSGMRAYQQLRKSGSCLSRGALMAQVTTKLPVLVGGSNASSDEPPSAGEKEHRRPHDGSDSATAVEARQGVVDWRWIAVGGTLAIVCGLQTGLIGNLLLLGAARRAAGRRN